MNALIVEINGKWHPEAYARFHLINMMSEFQGFDAYGFTSLGKPLLSSILANFMAYLIILIQFKVSTPVMQEISNCTLTG